MDWCLPYGPDETNLVCQKQFYDACHSNQPPYFGMNPLCVLATQNCRLDDGTTIECCNGLKCNGTGVCEYLSVGGECICDLSYCSPLFCNNSGLCDGVH